MTRFIGFPQTNVFVVRSDTPTHTLTPSPPRDFKMLWPECSIYWLITDLLDEERCAVTTRMCVRGWMRDRRRWRKQGVNIPRGIFGFWITLPIWPVFSKSYYTSLPAISPSVTMCSRGLRAQQSEQIRVDCHYRGTL